MDKNILKKIIVENSEFIIDLNIKSRYYSFEKLGNYVITGARRSGKSFLIYDYIKNQLIDDEKTSFVYVNFEDERLLEFTHKDFDKIIESGHELYQNKPKLFFDEIQNIDGWEKFARRLVDTNYQVIITGSNAQLLSKEIATILGGRYLIKEVLPLSFKAYLNFNDIKIKENFQFSKDRFKIKEFFNHFFNFGGFPEHLKYQNPKEYLRNIYMKVFYGDLIGRNHIKNELIVKLLIKKLAESVNNETSINRIKNIIKSVGIKIGNNTINNYIQFLIDAYLIFAVNNYVATFTERETKKKYYFIDQGILNLFLIDQKSKILENIVYLELLRRYKSNIFYYKRKYEVDFYLPNEKLLIQVSYSIAEKDTRQREVNSLKVAKNELGDKQLIIITYDEDELIEENDCQIEVISVWKWLLMEGR